VSAVPYRRIQVIVNPASGKDEPTLDILNDVFHEHGVEWDARVTHKFGDAGRLAREAIDDGVDLIAGYGGDGTQHEVANAIVETARAGGRSVPMGVLPGGTGNGYARELGTPRTLKAAAALLCTSSKVRSVDVGRVQFGSNENHEELFIQRLYLGMEPEAQTSRDEKNRYGVLAYPLTLVQRPDSVQHKYKVIADGESIAPTGTRIYIVNSGMTGSGVRVMANYSIDDGMLDAFMLDKETLGTWASAGERLLDLRRQGAARYYRRVRNITIDADPDQAVWADGENVGRTPISVDVLPGALRVVVA
jgi:diacylglycerol kinase (ATP)